MSQPPRVTHAVDHKTGNITITVELPGDDGPQQVALDGDVWKAIARGVLREYNAAENDMDPAAVVLRVRESLADAALRGLEPLPRDVRHRRMCSTVLHRLADMIQAGTINGFEGGWYPSSADTIELDVLTRHARETTVRIQLERGLIAEEVAA